jgi:hypothetical protein
LQNRSRTFSNSLPDTKRLKRGLVQQAVKPGYITPDEFLWVVDILIKRHNPTRLLIDNTAHLRIRFPKLHEQTMLVPAISSYTRSLGIMLIVIDVTGEGSNEKLSYGLSAAADFVFEMEALTKEEHGRPQLHAGLGLVRQRMQNSDGDRTWAKLSISNVRGQGHRRWVQAITVAPLKSEGGALNRLITCDITKASSPSLQELDSDS